MKWNCRVFPFPRPNVIFLPHLFPTQPTHRKIRYEIKDFRRTKISEQNHKIQSFDSAWGSKRCRGRSGVGSTVGWHTGSSLRPSRPRSPYLQQQWKNWSHFHNKVPRMTFQMVSHLIEFKPLTKMATTGFSEELARRWGLCCPLSKTKLWRDLNIIEKSHEIDSKLFQTEKTHSFQRKPLCVRESQPPPMPFHSAVVPFVSSSRGKPGWAAQITLENGLSRQDLSSFDGNSLGRVRTTLG